MILRQRDREAIEKMRQTLGRTQQLQDLMQCPKCGIKLATIQHHDVPVEECPSCKGLWLDRGEFEILSQRENEDWIGRFIRRSLTRIGAEGLAKAGETDDYTLRFSHVTACP